MGRDLQQNDCAGVLDACLGSGSDSRIADGRGAIAATQAVLAGHSAGGPFRGSAAREALLHPTTGVLRRAVERVRSGLCCLVSLSLSLTLLLAPRAAYALDPITLSSLSAEFLSSAFASVGSALTGVALPGLGVAGAVAGIGGYAWWANENPEEAELFEASLRSSLNGNVAANGIADQITLPVGSLPTTVKESIIDSVITYDSMTQRIPITNSSTYNSTNAIETIPYEIEGSTVKYKENFTTLFNEYNTGFGYVVFQNYKGNWRCSRFVFFDPSVFEVDKSNAYWYMKNKTNIEQTYTYIYEESIYGKNYLVQNKPIAAGEIASSDPIPWSGNASNSRILYIGIDLGAGFVSVPVLHGVSSGLTTAFDALRNGLGSVGDVLSAGNVGIVNLPGVTVDTATGEQNIEAVTNLTYADVAITEGGTVSPDTPAYGDDVLSALSSLGSQMSQVIDLVTAIPPLIPSLPADIARAIGGGVIDIPGQIEGIADTIIDIPGQIADVYSVIIDIPGQIADAYGAIINLPADIGEVVGPIVGGLPIPQILTGVQGLQGTLSSVLNGVVSLPAEIADSLGLDWALENADELNSRLPDGVPVFVLPTATWQDYLNANNDFLHITPIGPVWDFAGDVLDTVKGDGSPSAPRYVFVLPWLDGRSYEFVVDFADLGMALPVISHAFCYIAFAFFYVKFFRRVKSWYQEILPDPIAALPGGDE